MKTTLLSLEFHRLFSRRRPIWLAAIVVAGLLSVNTAHAQRRPPTIPNQGQPNQGQYWSPTNPNGTIMPISQLRNVPMQFGPATSLPLSNPYWSPSNPQGTIMPISQLRNVPMQFGPAIAAPR